MIIILVVGRNFSLNNSPCRAIHTVLLIESLLTGGIKLPDFLNILYPAGVRARMLLIIRILAGRIFPNLFGRTDPCAVGICRVVLIKNLIAGSIVIVHFLSTGRPVGAVMGSVLNIQRRSAGCVILANTLLRISQYAGSSIALIGSELYLTAGNIIDVGIFRIHHPGIVHPGINEPRRILACCEIVLLAGGTRPVVGRLIPIIGCRESNIAVSALFRAGRTEARAIRINLPDHRPRRIAVLIDRYALQHGVHIERTYRINRACNRRSAERRARKVVRHRGYVPLGIISNYRIHRKRIIHQKGILKSYFLGTYRERNDHHQQGRQSSKNRQYIFTCVHMCGL